MKLVNSCFRVMSAVAIPPDLCEHSNCYGQACRISPITSYKKKSWKFYLKKTQYQSKLSHPHRSTCEPAFSFWRRFWQISTSEEIQRASHGHLSISLRRSLLNISQVELPNLQLHLTDLIESTQNYYHTWQLPRTFLYIAFMKMGFYRFVRLIEFFVQIKPSRSSIGAV